MRDPTPPLLPTPRSFRRSKGRFRFRDALPIVLRPSSADSDFRAALALRDSVRARSGIELAIETHARRDDLLPRIELVRENGAAAEAYRLEVGERRILASADGAAGLRYAVETLVQLLPHGGRSAPACVVEDEPDFPRRGILVDVSRGKVPKLSTLFRIVDWMVQWKLNLLMLYTEHVFRFRRHPEIGEGASPLSASDVRSLDAYAAERHVELVPTLQSLGHMRHVLSIPRYRALAESERLWSLSPAKEETYRLLADLYAEYLPNFRSSWFNANCDEPVDLGRGASREWCEREGKGAVVRAHVERVEALAAALGKRTLVWADAFHEHPEEIPRLGKKLVLLDWWYEADHDYDRVKVFADNDLDFLVCPGTASWNTLFPRVDNALANIRGYARAGKRFGALGLVTTDWGDNGHGNLFGSSLYPLAYGAEAAWRVGALDERRFDRAFENRLFGGRNGAAGRICRRLGSLHETGFAHFNHSPLKTLFFEDLRDGEKTASVVPSVLDGTRRGLERVKADLRTGAPSLRREELVLEELRFALDASILAADKGLAGRRYLRDRSGEDALSSAERAALRTTLERLHALQRRLRSRFERLWLERNRRSHVEAMLDAYDASLAGLSAAAKSLRRARSRGRRRRKR